MQKNYHTCRIIVTMIGAAKEIAFGNALVAKI